MELKMYNVTIDVDPVKRLIRFAVTGYPAPNEVKLIQEKRRVKVRELRRSGTYFLMLGDLRQAGILPQDDAASVSSEMQWLVENGLRKSANIVASTLQQMQVNRMAGSPIFRCFTDEQEALDWLMS